MKISRIVLGVMVSISLIINIVVGVYGFLWLQTRMRPLPVKPAYMRSVIRQWSINSAGAWRVVSNGQDAIIIEYRLPISDIYRFKLSKDDFKLSDRFNGIEGPFGLSFDGCDISAKSAETGQFECMKFRDFSPAAERCK